MLFNRLLQLVAFCDSSGHNQSLFHGRLQILLLMQQSYQTIFIHLYIFGSIKATQFLQRPIQPVGFSLIVARLLLQLLKITIRQILEEASEGIARKILRAFRIWGV